MTLKQKLKKTQEDFKRDMKVKEGGIEKLAGKKVLGFMDDVNAPELQGLGVID
jgi:hypothetical protein